MKKILYTVLVVLLVFTSCDNGFEELNVDPTKSSQIAPQSKFTATLLRTSGERYEAWRANLIYQSTMMQHFATTAGYWSGDKYFWNKGYASSLFDRYYRGPVKGIEDIIDQLTAEGADYPAEMLAIAKIWRVTIYSRLTDLYGDIPYSEAGKGYSEGILKPKYDAQSAIYADMLSQLEEATSVLTGGTSEWGSADIIYGGDIAKWKRYGNSMMLRLGLRLIKVDPSGAQAWATKAISGGVMESNADIAYIQHTDGPGGINKNGNGEVFLVDGSPRISTTFMDFLKGHNDPRLPILAQRRSDGSTNPDDLIGFPNGIDGQMLLDMTGEENSNNYAEPNRSIITGVDAPMFFQTYAEVEFMLAEAAERWGIAGGDVEGHYNAGVRAAMKYLELYGPAAAISDADVDAYLAANPFDANNAMEMIATQYWAATFLNEYETFANWRRVELPVLVPTNYPGNETNGTIPRRLTWPTSEASANPENYAAAEAAQGPNVLTTRVWWDQ